MYSFAVLCLIGLASADTLVWEDQFDKLDFKKWSHEITLGGGGNWEFEWYSNNRTNSFVDEGVLYLQPTLTSENIGLDAMMHGDINIWGGKYSNECTSNGFYGCERNAAASGNYNNPIMSARLRSAGKFSFTNGRMEVRAQIPSGDWIWPAIWLLPENEEYGAWPASGEIDVMESRGNDASCEAGGRNTFASTLHWAPNYDCNQWEKTHADYVHPTDLSDDFHIYGLKWTEDRLMTYIDDESNVVLDVDMASESFWERGGFEGTGRDNPWKNEPNSAPFNRDFFIIMNVAVGGTNGYFPDGQCGKTWNTVNDFWNQWTQWYPTWEYPETNKAAMKIDWVQVWNLDTEESTFVPTQ